jgi:hypothetical protein
MCALDLAEFPIVGDRTPEIEHIARTLRSRLAVYIAPSHTHAAEDLGTYGARYHVLETRADLNLTTLPRLALVNAFTTKGSMTPSKITKLVRDALALQHDTVIVVLDEKSPEAVRAARNAGADEFLGRDEIKNEEALYWRVLNALLLSRVSAALDRAEPANPVKPSPLTTRKSTRLSAAELRAADAAIDAGAAALPSAQERRTRANALLQIVAPELRDPATGRLDARKIGRATGLSLAALARAIGGTQQALSATPDSPSAQSGLLPIARLSVLLDEMFTPEHKRVWLQTPHPRFGDRSPAQAIEAGDAELVALSVESALEGNPD